MWALRELGEGASLTYRWPGPGCTWAGWGPAGSRVHRWARGWAAGGLGGAYRPPGGSSGLASAAAVLGRADQVETLSSTTWLLSRVKAGLGAVDTVGRVAALHVVPSRKVDRWVSVRNPAQEAWPCLESCRSPGPVCSGRDSAGSHRVGSGGAPGRGGQCAGSLGGWGGRGHCGVETQGRRGRGPCKQQELQPGTSQQAGQGGACDKGWEGAGGPTPSRPRPCFCRHGW